MFIPLELKIGLRYLRAKRRNQFISFISLTSMLGIVLGVTALITVLSVMNGFEKELRERILGMALIELDDPLLDELFCGVHGRGATLNGRPIRVSRAGEMSQAMLATVFPAGRLSDRIGRRPIALVSGLVAATGVAIIFFFQSA